MQGRRTNMRHRAERKRKRLKTSKKAVYKELKLVCAIFYEIIFSPNEKIFFSLSRYSNFCDLFSSFQHFPDSQG